MEKLYGPYCNNRRERFAEFLRENNIAAAATRAAAISMTVTLFSLRTGMPHNMHCSPRKRPRPLRP